MERKIYSGWALDKDSGIKCRINNEIYHDLQHKTKMCYIDYKNKQPNYTAEDLQQYCCYEPSGYGYGHTKYRLLSNPHSLSSHELALIMDRGSLCFGYRREGDIFCIYTD